MNNQKHLCGGMVDSCSKQGRQPYHGKHQSRRILSGMLAGIMTVSAFFSGGAGLTVQAKEQTKDLISVSLETSEHGVLSFADTEGASLEVTAGDTVKVQATPEEGYVVDYISTLDEDGTVTDLNVLNNEVTLKVTKPVRVTAGFGVEAASTVENSNEGAFDTVEPKQSKARKSTTKPETYILGNMNTEYVGTGKSLTMSDGMHVTTTVVDGTKLENQTIDGLWADDDGDGLSDHADALYNQSESYIPLYEVGKDGKYFVGRASGALQHAKITDWGAAHRGGDGVVLDDVIFDVETGLVYVPKTYVTEKDGKKVGFQTRLQTLITADAVSDGTVTVPIWVNNKGVDGSLTSTGDAVVSLQAAKTEIQLAKDKTALDDIKNDTIDSIDINGFSYPNDESAWVYDDETGTLLIFIAPVAITDVKINLSETFAKSFDTFKEGVSDFFTLPVKANFVGGETTLAGDFTFSKTPAAGQSFVLDASNIYWGSHSVRDGFAVPMASKSDFNAGNFEARLAYQALGTQTVGHDMETQTYNMFRGTQFSSQRISDGTGNSMVTPDLVKLMLTCCAHNQHISIGGDMPGAGTPTNEWFAGKVNLHIQAVQGNRLLIGVVIPTANTQAGAGFFYANWKLEGGQIRLQKQSDKPEYTNGNNAYDMTGAKYGVYSDRACTDLKTTLTVQNNTGLTELSGLLPEGTYYTKELPGSALGYEINPHVMEFSVTAGQQNTIAMTGEMLEPAITDPMDIMVQKSFADWDEAGKVQGDVPTLEGVKFRVDYYSNLYTSVADAKKNPVKASAIFQTDAKGRLVFDTASPVDGTMWPYQDEFDYNAIPLGTVVITEVSALDGMLVSSAKNAKAFTITYNTLTGRANITPLETWPNQDHDSSVGAFDNEIDRGGVTVYKADADEHKQTPQGDGSLYDVTYEIVNKSQNSVSVEGKEIPVGGVAMQIKSAPVKGVAVATTGEKKLPFGSYTITEVNGNASYNKATWAKDFQIREDGQMVTYNDPEWNEDAVKRGGANIIKVDADTGVSTPQGDGELANTSFDIFNRSKNKVYVNGAWYQPNTKVMTIQTEWSEADNAYVAKTGVNVLPFGSYEAIETGAPLYYHKAPYKQSFQIRNQGELITLTCADEVFRGGVSITKADADWHTSNPQGDATLENTVYNIINRSAQAVFMREDMKLYQPGEVVMTLKTKWNDETQSYVASTKKSSLPAGTYQLEEKQPPSGYHNANWSPTFTIRQEGEMHYFDRAETSVTGPDSKYEFHHQWNEDKVMRGGITVGKVDRETGQYLSLGEAQLNGAVFEIINRSKHPVFVNGKTYNVGDRIMTIATKEMDVDGKTIYAATTGSSVLPVGTYELTEISSGTGYLFDDTSKAYTKTVSIKAEGDMINLTDEADAVANQVLREDFHFQKKQEDTMERMDKIAFVIESLTTGEKHVLVTDENGTWGSAWVKHSQKTNENDPTSPITNGALDINEAGDWYVKDSSKLNFDSGMWFTGLSPDQTTWADDGKSYTVNEKSITVNDALRAFPYDTYRVKELRCENNIGYKLVNFTVTLHRYTADHNGPGLDIDYGTIDDKRIAIGTTLTHVDGGKVAPATKDTVLSDIVTYDNLDVGKAYAFESELHVLKDDGSDGGVIATETTSFTPTTESGRTTTTFTFDASTLAGKTVVSLQYLKENGEKIAEHADLADTNQMVKFPEIKTTLTGDMDHLSNGGASEITLNDKISYTNLEVGVEYTAHGTLMDAKTDEPILGADGNPIVASRTFTPTKETGTINVVFRFSGVDMAGKTVVAFESVQKDDVEYAVHADLEDADQTVHFPKVDTYAVDGVDGNKDMAAAKGQTITDAINVANLMDGYDYKMVGELRVRNTDGTDMGTLNDAKEKPYTAELSWSGNKQDQKMTFADVDTSALGGKDIVIYQTLYGRLGDGDWAIINEHKDIANDKQHVRIPNITTTLLSDQSLHEIQVPKNGNVTIEDTVQYENVTPGHTYAISGTLHKQAVDKDGKLSDGGTVTLDDKVIATFKAKETSGSAKVKFTFDASDLSGSSIVAFEDLYSAPMKDIPEDWSDAFADIKPNDSDIETLDNAWIVASHADITDANQTIQFVDLKTTLLSNAGLHEMQVPTGPDKTITLTDTITYQNLIPGNTYTATGVLHGQSVDKDGMITDGGTLKHTDGTDVTGTATFTPTEKDGKVAVIFTFDATGLDGQTVVAYEELATQGNVFATHKDITDEAQSVRFVFLKTEAMADNGLHQTQVPSKKQTTLVDTVSYKNVIPGTEYTVTGTLHVQSVDDNGVITDAGAFKQSDGKEVTGTTTFTPEKASGTVDVTFVFDATGLDGKTVTVFETLTKENAFIANHADITDKKQMVHFVELRTRALFENGTHELVMPKGDKTTVKITDLVEYRNLMPGLEYTVEGEFHVASGNTDGGNGTWTDTSDDTGAWHGDPALDPLAPMPPSLGLAKTNETTTTKDKTTDTKDKTTTTNETVTDGGVLKDKNGNAITAKATFTPKESSGKVTVTFEVDVKGLENQTLVAFETLYYKDAIVAVHQDITDKFQSVKVLPLVEPPAKETPKTPVDIVKTGQTPFYALFTFFGLAVMAGAGYLYLRKKRG